MTDSLLLNQAAVATTPAATATSPSAGPLGLIDDGAVLIEDGLIAWVGNASDAPRTANTHACGGRLLTPGLIDCHTHLVFGGDRSAEFEQRLNGDTYEQIARAGGGIVSSVRATRAASEDELRTSALVRLDALLASGVTTVEIKSGYGLDLDTEARCLSVARSLARKRQVDIKTTYLGAHALPPEFSAKGEDGRSEYLDLVVDTVLPAIAQRGLADAVDGFCEGIAFSTGEIARVFDRARELGLAVKLHAEQLSNLGGAQLAAQYAALSADHLEYLDLDGVRAMANAGTVAVLLPGAFYYLRETQKPPVGLLRQYGVPIAVATDLNPGSSPVQSLLTTLNMACVLFELTPTEALLGVTVNAARALGLTDRGQIAVGMRADLALWNVCKPVELCYPLGHQPLQASLVEGTVSQGALP